jgi:YD repeat-containing protein
MPRPTTAGTATQVRTWSYDQLTQRLTSVTMPETGTTSYAYNTDGTVKTKTDAKGQVTEYVYDDKKRVTEVRNGVGGTARVKYYYETNPLDGTFSAYTTGRLAAAEYLVTRNSGATATLYDMYRYRPWGGLEKKRLQGSSRRTSEALYVTWHLDVAYTFDSEGRVATVAYPTGGSFSTMQYVPGAPKLYMYEYDTMGRPSKMKEQRFNQYGDPYWADLLVQTVAAETYICLNVLNCRGNGASPEPFASGPAK